MIIYNEDDGTFSPTTLDYQGLTARFGSKITGNGKNLLDVTNHLSSSLQPPFQVLIKPKQIHSSNVEIVTTLPNERIRIIEETDGIITNLKNVVLTILTADCVPILFADTKNKIIGASHQGWRGTLKRLPERIIKMMQSVGAEISSIRVAIGPAIGECCYDIDDERYYSFMEQFERYEHDIIHVRKNVRHLSLNALNYYVLRDLGIAKEHIDFFPFCTKCDSERFFSFRRDKHTHNGEMFSYIMQN